MRAHNPYGISIDSTVLVRAFAKRFAIYAIGPLSVCPVCPVCHVGVLRPSGWTDQDKTWHARSLGPRHIVLDWNPGPPPQRGTLPQFSAHVYCDKTAG